VAVVALGLALPGVTGPARAQVSPAPSPAPSPPPSTAQSPAPSPGKVAFTVGILHDVDSLNPFTGVLAEAAEADQVMYDSLESWSAKDLTPAPLLATQVRSSPDGRTWTYTIRSGVTWSDGVPLTARDVAYTYDRILHGAYERTTYGDFVKGVTGVTAPNDTTVVMTTRDPSPIMAHQTVPILPEHVWSRIGATAVRTFANDSGAVGSGPFVLAEHRAGRFLRFTANPHYWGGAPRIDELVYRVYPSQDALAAALRGGSIDFADGLRAGVWNGLKGTPGLTLHAGRYPGFDELGFNTGAALDDGTPIGDGHPALTDPRVRRALSYAVDRQALVARVLDGHGSVATTIVPPLYPSLHLDPASPYTFDPAKANGLLDAAGYPRGPDDVRLAPGGRPLQFRLYARAASQDSQQVATSVRDWFGRVGVQIDVIVLAENELSDRIGRGDFDLFEWGWVPEPDPDHQLATLTCAERPHRAEGTVLADLSDSFYCNPAYDRLYAQQATQVDPAARAATVKRAEQIAYDDAPYALLYYYDDLQAYNARWAGFVPQPVDRGVLLFQFGAWSYPHIDLVARTPGAESVRRSGSLPPVAWVALGVAVVALVAAGVLAILRGRLPR
jgi:peptide/nickel transport system substrate-binding protein